MLYLSASLYIIINNHSNDKFNIDDNFIVIYTYLIKIQIKKLYKSNNQYDLVYPIIFYLHKKNHFNVIFISIDLSPCTGNFFLSVKVYIHTMNKNIERYIIKYYKTLMLFFSKHYHFICNLMMRYCKFMELKIGVFIVIILAILQYLFVTYRNVSSFVNSIN